VESGTASVEWIEEAPVAATALASSAPIIAALAASLFAATPLAEPGTSPGRGAGARRRPEPTRFVRVHDDGRTRGETPLGMCLVPDGSFRMGVPLRAALELAAGEHASYASQLVAMTPDHDVKVAAVLIDRVETTNEQFRLWLAAEKRAPSKELLDFNWNRFEKGKRVDGLPPGAETLPVRAVTFDEAAACARWLGKRLPTEAEWEYAARRGRAPTSFYPWGLGWIAWDHERCASARSSMRGRTSPTCFVAGSFADDRSFDGLVDLCGNVAEWTDSPFAAYPRFEPVEPKGRTPLFPEFSWDQKAVRGGSSWGNELSNSLVMRFGQAPGCAAEAVGFRCAMSAIAGLDALEAARRDLVGAMLPLTRLDLDPRALAAQTIQFVDATSGLCDRARCVAFTRVKTTDRTAADFRRAAVEAPALVGIVTFSEPCRVPALPAGSYGITFKSKGRPKPSPLATPPKRGARGEKDAEPAKATGELPAPPVDQDLLLFTDRAGRGVGWLLVEPRDTAPRPTRFSIASKEDGQRVRFSFAVPHLRPSTAIELEFELTFEGAPFDVVAPK
jgi:formylglycine-generating enzyme required for sulfatase activity